MPVVVVNSSRGDALSDPGFAQPADLDWVRSTLTDAGVSFTIRQEVRGREASEEVLDVVNELNARLCVIGIRRRSAVGKMLLGSNAFRILMHAPCPVLAIKRMRMAEAAGMGQDNLPATADLVDSYGEDLDSIPVQFRSFGLRRRFGGPVVTLKCFEDNALLKATLGDPAQPPGCVLVVDGGARCVRRWSVI